MECIAPDEITEDQLLAYCDGEADDATLAHIGRCRHCAERVRALNSDYQALRSLLYRVECPDAHTLGEFHLGLLTAEEQAAIEDHLKSCPDCTTEIQNLDRFLREVAIAPESSSVQRHLKRLVARLATPPADPTPGQSAMAFRGVAAAAPDVYLAGDIRVVVGLEADGMRAGRKMLLGFTAREGKPLESLSGARVQLSQHGQAVAMEHVDTLGNFVFSDLSSGEYELALVTDREQVVIETIVV
jgi:hypothetical protein